MNTMADNLHSSLTFNFKQILIDEIALNGLAGIGFHLLWKHVEKRISTPLTDKMKTRFWSFLRKCDCVSFYEVPEPLDSYMELLDRFALVEVNSGDLMDPPVELDGHYEYCPVENNHGSCSNFHTRKDISKEKLAELASYEAVWTEYGATLVMVASQEERWRALAPHVPYSVVTHMTPIHYCILELVGKSRENGQMTVGNTNITKIVKEPKFLFYNRKQLQELDLVRVVCVTVKQGEKGVKGLLIRLKRFHKPSILSVPKVGALYNLRQYLLEQPNYCAKTSQVITKGLITQQTSKRLQKTINVFKFDEKFVQAESSSKKGEKAVVVKRRFISLHSKSDESSQSEDESNTPLKCQYKVGVDLFRQAYEIFLEAGIKGLTQFELAQLIGIEFYTSRTICRVFKAKHIIREHLEDRGKQRTARYFAIAAATGEMDQKYEEQKQKLLEYVKSSKSCKKRQYSVVEDIQDDDDIPLKKMKLSSKDQESNRNHDENEVIEIKVLDGLENFNSESLLFSKKNPTLRQLRFANGLLKVTTENQVVSGYQTLSSLVSKDTGEPPMDTKALKIFVQKLVTDGLLKLMKIRWPGYHQKYSILICAPFVKCTDAIIKSKQKEISIRALTNKKVKKEKIVDIVHRPPSQYAYPRYMKIQLLHEFLMKLVYFEDKITVRNLPRGFASLVSIIPEITVELAIGNISNLALSDIMHLKIDQDVLGLKLRDAPEDLYQNLLQSKSLQSSIRINLKVLAMLGLIQLVNEPNSQSTEHCGFLSSYIFYVNKQAKILDTTGIWPRENNDVLEKTFYFETFSNVKNYWNEVYEISTHTTIEHADRARKKLTPPVRQIHQVQEHDSGERFGNGAGPCGFDACFYMEHSRFWRTFYSRIIKNKPIRKQTLKKKTVVVAEKKPKKIKIKEKKARAKPVAQEKQMIPRSKIKRRRHTTPAVRWSDWEDTILMMCKVAITIMSPISQPGCCKVRNNAAKDLLGLFDKTKIGSVCHRRSAFLESNMALEHDKECLINELRRKRHLILKYEGLLKKIRIRNITNIAKFISEARTPMLELLWIINQLVKTRSSSAAVPCVATDIEDFRTKYNVCTTTANKPCNGYKADADADLSVTLVKEIIMQSIISTFRNTPPADYAKRLYSILAEFPERTLRVGLEQLRKCGAVSCKDKVLNYHLHRFTTHDSVQMSYKIAAAYERRWINRLNTDFPGLLADLMESNMPETNIKASPEMNCIISEFQASGILEIVAETVPVITGSSGSIIQEQQLNVIDIEMKFKLKSGIIGWKNVSDVKHLTDHFHNINLEHFSDTLLRNSIVEVTTEQEDKEDIIVRHLKEQGKCGVLFSDLLNHFGDNPAITQKLKELESKNVIKRVGFYENRIILTEFAKAWATKIDDKLVIPTPWLTFYFDIRKDIFFKWSSVIMNKVFEQPGCSIAYISNTYEVITTRAVQEICMFLEACQCMTLRVLRTPEIDLFSEDTLTEFSEFTPYEAPENIYAFPLKDSLTKYAYIKKKILQNKNQKDSETECPGSS